MSDHGDRGMEFLQRRATDETDLYLGPPRCPVCGSGMIPIAYGLRPHAPEGWDGPIKAAGCVVGRENWWCQRCRKGHIARTPQPPVVLHSDRSGRARGRPMARVTSVTVEGRPLTYARATLTIRLDPPSPSQWKAELSGTDPAGLIRDLARNFPMAVTLSNGLVLSGTGRVVGLTDDDAVLLGREHPKPAEPAEPSEADSR